jgi:acyl-CoA:acyl-CoA alkyltransferase
MPQRRARITEVASYLPRARTDNAGLLARLHAPFPLPRPDVLQRLCGIRERYIAEAAEQVSDMAAAAARPIVDSVGAKRIDLLLFAAACSDLIEPATGNIVQAKLGLQCPIIDIKNACNSFVSAIQVATALIESGSYRRILIVNGEKLSDAIRCRYESEKQLADNLAALTLGDGGAAMLMEESDDPSRGVVFQRFLTLGQHWRLCTIPGGGSMFPHDLDSYFFSGQTSELRDVVYDSGCELWRECEPCIGWEPDEIAWVFTHQVSEQTWQDVVSLIGVEAERCVNLFATHGNMAAASIPVCMASVRDRLCPGDKILLVGLAAGVSISYQAIVW